MKTTLVSVALILFGFYAVTLLFFVGNPFATTTGAASIVVDNMTIPNVPLGNGQHTNITIGHYSMNVTGSNWDLAVSRLLNGFAFYEGKSIAGSALSNSIATQPTSYERWGIAGLGFGAGFLLALAIAVDVARRRKGARTN